MNCANCGKQGDWAKYCSVSCACIARNKSIKQRIAVAETNRRDSGERLRKARAKMHKVMGMTKCELALYLHPEFPESFIPQTTPFDGTRRVADFVDLDRKLILEVDGWDHKNDFARTFELACGGFTVFRVTNDDVESDLDLTIRYIKYRIQLFDNNYKEEYYAS